MGGVHRSYSLTVRKSHPNGFVLAKDVRSLVGVIENETNVKIGQVKGILADGTKVVDIFSGVLCGDRHGFAYSFSRVECVKFEFYDDVDRLLIPKDLRPWLIASKDDKNYYA